MTPARRAFLRQVMQQAWSVYRLRHVAGSNVKTFGHALRNAWAWLTRKPVVATAPVHHLVLRSMVQSPISRSLTGQVYAGTRARAAGYTTSMMGR